MLAIAMITCDRPNINVHRAIEELRWGGFDELLHLFCEPGTPAIRPLAGVAVHRNETRRGVLGNWKHALHWLIEHTTADFLMICEDDVAYCQGARAAWEASLNPCGQVGFWSLYTPARDRCLVSSKKGWVASNRGRDAWGTQAMCFPRASAELLLEYRPLHEEDQLRGATDAIVCQCFVDAGLPCFYHNPSLADHLGRVSSVGHNWYDEHVGLDFDRDFQPGVEAGADCPVATTSTEPKRFVSTLRRTAVVTVFQDNVPPEVVSMQAEVICRMLPVGCEFEPRRVSHHALGLDDYFRELRHEAYCVLDVDCIPLADWVIPWFLENALAGAVLGAAQRANHLENGGHLYAGPCALAFSRATFERLGPVSFGATDRGDVAEEVTYACERLGIPVSLLWPTHVTTPKWTLRPDIPFGLGTTFGGAVYHAFEISKGHTVGMFLDKCRQVLAGRHGGDVREALLLKGSGQADGQPAAKSTEPIFHEEWYADSELVMLEAAARFTKPLPGAIVEIGSWEGRSTSVLANACFPQIVIAVDSWQGSVAENPDHETVRIARERDVFAVFQHNMRVLTRGNVEAKRMDTLDFLKQASDPIKFCHVDAAHDYRSVRESLDCLLPRLVPGGVLFGHDYASAHAGRHDLDGGVERAVREVLPTHEARGNNWWYVHMTR